jgi:hypothetical protein
MATILDKFDFDDSTVKKKVDKDGVVTANNPDGDNTYLIKGDIKYEYLWRTLGVLEVDLKPIADISNIVKEVLVYHVSARVATTLIKSTPAPLNTNVNYNMDEWAIKCKKWLAQEEQYEALLTKNDFMTDAAIDLEENANDDTNRFFNERVS